jgi:hypothetical protein
MPGQGAAGLDGDGDGERMLASFSRHLDEYAETLPPEEQRLLMVLIQRAMSPQDRIRAVGADSLLSADEQRYLEQLDSDPGS